MLCICTLSARKLVVRISLEAVVLGPNLPGANDFQNFNHVSVLEAFIWATVLIKGPGLLVPL